MVYIGIGGMFYIVWGLLHVGAGVWFLFLLTFFGPKSVLVRLGLAHTERLSHTSLGVISSLIGQHAANLAIFGLLAIILATFVIRRRDVALFLLNAIIIGLVDAAFIQAFYVRGYVRGIQGAIGPILFFAATLFTAIGFFKNNNRSHSKGGQ